MTRDTTMLDHSVDEWDQLEEYTPIDDTTFDEKALPFRSRSERTPDGLSLELHPLPEQDGIIVSIDPPREPKHVFEHVSCDIVLVIDTSTSMNAAAPAPKDDTSIPEDSGLSVLDLVRHASRTIVQTLNVQDRLGIVTYGSTAEVVQELIWMNDNNKKDTVTRIENLKTNGMTNMWQGIKDGLDLFKTAKKSRNVTALMVLTDGMPNLMCPPQGYVPKLRTFAQLAAPIHTFGFGNSIKSGLLKSISEVSGGNFAFIPDSGMIGTVFIHAVANLQNTFATGASLTIQTPKGVQLVQTCGNTVEQTNPAEKRLPKAGSQFNYIEIPVGSIHYGQSRDIYLQYIHDAANVKGLGKYEVRATISYTKSNTRKPNSNPRSHSTIRSLADTTCRPQSWIVYHRTRSSICRLLSSLYPIRPNDHEHVALEATNLEVPTAELQILIQNLKSLNLSDEANQSLLSDLCGDDPHGQVTLSLKPEYWRTWGRHYLMSLWNAHATQACNTFKDPGPLLYARDAPLFVGCRDALDAAFDALPAPKPSRAAFGGFGQAASAPANGKKYVAPKMARWNNRGAGCFAAHCEVLLASGEAVPISALRRGAQVWTAAGPRAVAEVVKWDVSGAEMCVLGDCVVTPWHPVRLDGDVAARTDAPAGWVFPDAVAQQKTAYDGSIISVLLQRDVDERAHRIKIGGIIGVTLGHGIGGNRKGDARAHDFFGNYDLVQKSLENLPKDEQTSVRLSSGITRGSDGLVNGFGAE